MDPTRLHPQGRNALGVQQRVPLTLDNLAEARHSMVAATPAEVGTGPAVRRVLDVDAGGVPGRLYHDGPEPHDGAETVVTPTILYAHGGGWVLGDLETHDGLCRALAAASGWAVLAVDYRRAPESPYPAALDDLARALGWLRAQGDGHGLDPRRVAVAGDSAGGQLAAALARRARDAGTPLAAHVLICPVISPPADYPPLDDYGLHGDEMRFFWDAYAPPGIDRGHPDLDLLRAELVGLPPAVVITAELDVLCEEGERYAQRLLAAGVPVVATRYLGMIHNFPRKLALFDAAHAAVAQLATVLRGL